VPDRAHTEEEIDAAIAAITDGDRLQEAQDLVMRAAPSLQNILASALEEGGWFGSGHAQAIREAVAQEDPQDRVRVVQSLLAEETRLGMLVGVAVGFELARELRRSNPTSTTQED
jgi:hypothetical protein